MLKRVPPTPSLLTRRSPLSSPHLFCHRFYSPIGTILAVSDGDYLHAIDFGDYEVRLRTLLKRRLGAVSLIEGEDPLGVEPAFQAYFRGELAALEALPVGFTGTPFQNQVWLGLQDIPAGNTVSYSWLAKRVGNASAQRAVGFAVGQNPVAIVVPCHRVIGATGALTGYAGGVARKRWLLTHEERSSTPVARQRH